MRGHRDQGDVEGMQCPRGLGQSSRLAYANHAQKGWTCGRLQPEYRGGLSRGGNDVIQVFLG